MAERVAVTAARYNMFSGGETVVVAVSGGPDSSCLLDVLARLGAGLELVVAHVDHGLSDHSEEVSTQVAARAAKAGYDVHVVRAKGLEGSNLHARAREFRYAFLEGIASEVGATRIATGHTLDDRVETSIARLIHGAGTEGLAGIPPVEGLRVRPLIELRRAEAKAYCDEVGLDPFEDPANDDLRFDRAAVRNEIVSVVEARWGDGAVRAMATSAERLREDATALASVADRLYRELAEAEGGVITFKKSDLIALPRAYRRRLLERAVGRMRDRSGGIDEALDALDRDDLKPDARFAVVEGYEIVIGRDDIKVVDTGAAAAGATDRMQ